MNPRCAICGKRAGLAGYCRDHALVYGFDVVDRGYTTSCWVWTGFVNNRGYPRFGNEYAHRISFELHVGPLAPGLEPDHLCKVPVCINPSHMEAVTHTVNVLRSDAPGAIAVRTNRCIRNHEFTPENTYHRIDGGGRQCRECRRIRARGEHSSLDKFLANAS